MYLLRRTSEFEKSFLLANVLHLICGRNDSLSVPETKVAATKGPMKEISDLFSDEEKKQLSYLGSMLRREPTEEEAEQPEGSRLVCRQQ
jgi:hypothetical protein